MYLLDSDIMIWALRGKSDVVKVISKIKDQSKTHISTMTVAEVYMGMFPSEETATEDLLHQNLIIPVSEDIAKEGGLYFNQFRKLRLKMSISDCLIAATAKVNDLILVTLNTRHFPMGDIKVVNPLKS